MLRRLRWMAAGAGLGLGGRWWVKRTARRATASLRPAEVSRRMAAGARLRVRAARLDASTARRDTEQRLRQRLSPDAPVLGVADVPPEAAAQRCPAGSTPVGLNAVGPGAATT